MTLERTELEWLYRPQDFFEAAYRHADGDRDVLIEGGRVVATLAVPQNPVDEDLEKRIGAYLAAIFLGRQMQTHRAYELEGPRIYQHANGRKNVTIRVGVAASVTSVGQPDIVLRTATGVVLRDTKTERIAEHTKLIDAVAPKATRSPALRELLTSYSRAVSDPSNELVHLYEVRDALVKYYGGEQNACAAMNITRSEWQRVGVLANVEPLEEGRHRGKHVAGRRGATGEELNEARSIVRRWIIAFAQTL